MGTYDDMMLAKLYYLNFIKKLLVKYTLTLIKAENKIFDEKQRVEDKIYIICKKI